MKRETLLYKRVEVGKLLQKYTVKMKIPLKIQNYYYLKKKNLVISEGGQIVNKLTIRST